jgi:hypothetical protein
MAHKFCKLGSKSKLSGAEESEINVETMINVTNNKRNLKKRN